MEKESTKASTFEEAFFCLHDTYVHPTAIVGSHVELDKNVKIGPHCILMGNVFVGSGSRLHANVIVGTPAQTLETKKSFGKIIIKKNCEIREFVTIHASRYTHGETIVGNNCYLMNFSHVSHDSILEDQVTLVNNVSLGGHTYVEKNAILMAGTATHQFCRIGRCAALAPFSAIRQDLPPFCLFNGKPAAFAGLNMVGLRRNGLKLENIAALKSVTRLFYQKKNSFDKIENQALREPWGNDIYVQEFMKFIKSSKRGVSRD
jgi:UDP-N-acetylglucosamine acyltransferase